LQNKIKIYLFEASSRFGGWMESKKVQVGEDTVYFEKGPRTLRLSTGEPKELNSLKLVNSTLLAIDFIKKLLIVQQTITGY
jgi:protoporphyrinogen oxidase